MRRRTILALSACTALTVLSYGSSTHIRAAGLQSPSVVAARDPTIYAHVSHLGWVVRDVDATAAAWRSLGVTNIRDGGVQELAGVAYRGATVTARVRKAFARFDNGTIEWIQPSTRAPYRLPRPARGRAIARSVPTDASDGSRACGALGVRVLQAAPGQPARARDGSRTSIPRRRAVG